MMGSGLPFDEFGFSSHPNNNNTINCRNNIYLITSKYTHPTRNKKPHECGA